MKIIAGNWKMNGSSDLLTEMIDEISKLHTENRVILCVPYTMLRGGNSVVMIGAQNISKYDSGAYTGEISGQMISATGATVTLVGHSECRELLHDTNSDVSMRAKHAINNDLLPIICIGETAVERDTGLTETIVRHELRESVPENAIDGGFIVAYEPRWAIGSGVRPTTTQIAKVTKVIRETLQEMGFVDTPILYGGSVTAQISQEIMNIENIDGVLVGGASLKKDDFIPIIKSAK